MHIARSEPLVLLPSFARTFMEDHARRLLADPRIALAEIIANCWDAGADRVDVTWPALAEPAPIEIMDNGCGMTYEEFTRRWLQFSYDRKEEQGEDVVFPAGNRTSHRKAFGRSGKGRHGMFCFANSYEVETWRDGEAHRFVVEHASGVANIPYTVTYVDRVAKQGHGTRVRGELVRNYLDVPALRQLIGSKFVTDPTFDIYVNGQPVDLTDIASLIHSQQLDVPGVGAATVSQVDTQRASNTSLPHGIAWWVNRRLVGDPSWDCINEDVFVDRRTAEAKRYTFVVEADCLAGDVQEDWSGFRHTERVAQVQAVVAAYIETQISGLMREAHQRRKRAALDEHVEALRDLPPDAQYAIGCTVEGLQERIPTVSPRVLAAVVGVLAGLEHTRASDGAGGDSDPDVAAVLSAPRQRRLPMGSRAGK